MSPSPSPTAPGARRLHFVIVGGSLGGLATGIALNSLGHKTTILERNPTPLLQDQGAGIVAGGDTLEFLEKYVRFIPKARTSLKGGDAETRHEDEGGRDGYAINSTARVYLDRQGNVVHRKESEQYMTSWDMIYHLLRANYDAYSSEYCEVPPSDPGHGAAAYAYDRTVVDIQIPQTPSSPDDKVAVHWKSSTGETGSIEADYLIGADGPSSTVRTLALKLEGRPPAERTYAGYCALRGTVIESDPSISRETLEIFTEKFTFFHGPRTQILCYLIPGTNGTTAPGHRLLNFVWYVNFPESSTSEPNELEDIMTDIHGKKRNVTVSPGLLDPAAWAKQCDRAKRELPSCFSEVVCAARKPFVQKVTDVLAPEHEFCQGRVVLIGDALAGFRPHTVASTSQAMRDADLLAGYMNGMMGLEGGIGRDEWKRETLGLARTFQRRGVEMGRRSQELVLGLDEYVQDRERASLPRDREVWGEWTTRL
ncbi:FAD/NAD(P)-binding domain-containing protein [Xylariaceae sp. FL1272]|nr:FAD/NAD(P)-binding domain-containing protein [Xylariaceae sp. FL1272]